MAQWNHPHPTSTSANTRYSSFAGPPKTLDPAKAYSSNELQFIAQIYEPLLQYHYLKRPYVLEPLTASKMPVVSFYDAQWQPLPSTTPPDAVTYSVYDIHIQSGIRFQASPAFAKDASGAFRYHDLPNNQTYYDLTAFAHEGTRELTAEDYAYEIKRIAAPWVHSPIYGLMSEHILGLSELSQQLATARDQSPDAWLDLRQVDFPGVKVLSPTHFQIVLKGVYPQFMYWLAMPFFAPIAWEVDAFYQQPVLQPHNINLDWYPVGTGPYQLIENNPNQRMVLSRNPLFRGEAYPTDGEQGDQSAGYLADAGKTMPFIDRVEFHLEKESIPRWNKFLQGYYDYSGISADSFDQAVQLDADGVPVLTPAMKQQHIRLQTTVSPSVYYLGFNMLDPVVGGDSDRARYLRQAIAMTIDYEEYIAIFMNGRGIAANSPIPPGIAGFHSGKQGMNSTVYRWDGQQAVRRSLSEAQALMKKAGYPGGVDPATHQPLVIHYDVSSGGGADDKARFQWTRKQLAKIGIQLDIRSTQYNRFRDKVKTGQVQLFSWGWLADYPDPENFLFLLYGPNGKVQFGGENTANYNNPEFNRLFEQMIYLPDGEQREAVIKKMVTILQRDTPWVWGVHPIDFTLSHTWNQITKPNAMANNTLKYQRLDPKQRQAAQDEWNQPWVWPVLLVLGVGVILVLPLGVGYWRRERRPAIQRKQDKT